MTFAPALTPPRTDAGHRAALLSTGRASLMAAKIARPDYRPGERIVAGKVYVYDLDALNLHLAYEARDNAPADLSVLSDLELALLDGAAGRIWADTCGADDELSGRVDDEQRRRGRSHMTVDSGD